MEYFLVYRVWFSSIQVYLFPNLFQQNAHWHAWREPFLPPPSRRERQGEASRQPIGYPGQKGVAPESPPWVLKPRGVIRAESGVLSGRFSLVLLFTLPALSAGRWGLATDEPATSPNNRGNLQCSALQV